MIYCIFNIRNPWRNKSQWASKYFKDGKTPFNHKYWEVQIAKSSDILLRFKFSLTSQQDHAGAVLEIGAVGWEFYFTFYDNRHWNIEESRWYQDNETQL